MCCPVKKLWLKIREKISVIWSHKGSKTSSLTPAERPRKKNYIDAALDAVYGPEGGEGEQWPPIKL